MKTTDDKLKFWIRSTLYIQNDSPEDLVNASIKRAYLDFNRTMRGFAKKSEGKKIPLEMLQPLVEKVRSKKFESQEKFDEWHKEQCYNLKDEFKKYFDNFPITIGQCQKWINMTFKYLHLLGEDEITGIEQNYYFFHIPIDSIIQERLLKKYNIEKFLKPWSKIDDYQEYLNYQKKIRETPELQGQIPLDIEIKLFNENQ